MCNSAHDFLGSAQSLVAGALEIDHRNAASRAYYAAFHNCSSVKHLCPDNAHLHINAGEHKRLILRFREYPKKQPGSNLALGISYMLEKMKSDREDADYEISVDFPSDRASLMLSEAKRMFDKTSQFSHCVINTP